MTESHPPSGTVTFLFTDIEGSTRLWDAHHAAMAVAVAEHDALLRQVITEHGGFVFKTVGDAFCAAFPSVANALEAALAAQRLLASRTWPEVGTLRVRMGLHTGEAEERDNDYFGPAVNRVARLMSAGHGGQVLLSRASAETLGALPDGAELRDLGDRRLKDLTQPERIFQLVVPGLPQTFPPLNSLDARPNNLPVQPTPLLGRVDDLAALEERLRRPGTRVITLTGPGGTGKTRLALQAAADLIDHFPHGVWFVDLGAVTEPDLVAAETARALGVREESGRSLNEQLVEHLRDKELLLVLDNFEQVLPAARLVGELVRSCPKLKLLVTSRAPLRIGGEQEYPVPPLPVPDPKRLLDLAHLEAYPSVELFVERAAAVKPGFTLTAENARSVAEVCVALDGLPLAIELAAARVRLLPPAKLAERLGRRLQVLTGGQRDRPERQQTLRATIAWSHDLLAPEGQALFARLSVFAGGCTLEAAEAVVNVMGDLDIFDGLEALVEHSLVRQEEPEDGEPRFRMLATIREFAEERLTERGETEDLRQSHADYYVAYVDESLAEPDDAVFLNRLGAEHDNLRAVLTWSGEMNQSEMALHLAGSLWGFWYARGHLSEGRYWLEQSLAQGDGTTKSRAKALYGTAVLAEVQGELDQAVSLYEQARELYRSLDDVRGVGLVLGNLGDVAAKQGRYEEARGLYDEALAVQRGTGDKRGETAMLINLGNLASLQGDHGRAAALHEEALDLAQGLDDRWLTALAHGNLAGATRDQGHLERAVELYHRALLMWQELGGTEGVIDCLAGLACTASAQGQPERAARLFGAAEGLAEATNHPVMPVDHALYESSLEAARSALGSDAFAVARAAGRSMRLEDAITEAAGIEVVLHKR